MDFFLIPFVLSQAIAVRGRRRVGGGIVSRLTGQKQKKKLPRHVREQMDDYQDYRPYFTYWVITVQIVICIASLALHGFGPIGLGRSMRSANIRHRTFTTHTVSFFEQESIWIGPSYVSAKRLLKQFFFDGAFLYRKVSFFWALSLRRACDMTIRSSTRFRRPGRQRKIALVASMEMQARAIKAPAVTVR